MATACSANLFGTTPQYIKTNGGDIIATDGAGIKERLILSDLRIPYKQILKSRIILKAGQANYLLNSFGIGDNSTFLSIKAVYDNKSKNEANNYVNWSYYDNLTRINSFADLMVLTGNSAHRIPQLYLTNPNVTYPVYLDVMVGVIDDNYSIYTDILNQTGTSFVNLEYTDIHTHVVGESIVINDKSNPVRPLIYFMINNINSIEISGQILIIDDGSRGSIFLQFLTQNDAYQAYSLLNYILENNDINIDNLNPLGDSIAPIIYFNDKIGDNYITFNGATNSVPYNTSVGITFSTIISLTHSSGTPSSIEKQKLIDLLIDNINDNRDGDISIMPSNLYLSSATSSIDCITATGSYSLTFSFCDMAHNYINPLINIDII